MTDTTKLETTLRECTDLVARMDLSCSTLEVYHRAAAHLTRAGFVMRETVEKTIERVRDAPEVAEDSQWVDEGPKRYHAYQAACNDILRALTEVSP